MTTETRHDTGFLSPKASQLSDDTDDERIGFDPLPARGSAAGNRPDSGLHFSVKTRRRTRHCGRIPACRPGASAGRPLVLHRRYFAGTTSE
jgi:hypothetical protein